MSIEALWAVYYGTGANTVEGGVVVLETNRIFGGDSQYYYTGTYSTSPDQVSGRIRVRHYQGQMYTAFEDNAMDFEIDVTLDRVDEETLAGFMKRVDGTPPELPLKFKHLQDLP